MSETKLCRLCTGAAEEINSEHLFDRNQRKLLRQIEELIGERLKNANDLPQHICKPCEEQTTQAHAFRERCIQSQQHFAMQIKKERSQNKKPKLKEIEKSSIEEVALNDFDPVKEEQDEKYKNDEHDENENDSSVIAEVIFKDEPNNSDEDKFSAADSDECFNNLDENQTHKNNTTDDEQYVLTIEPEINLVAGEESLQNDSELPEPLEKSNSTTTTKRKTSQQKLLKEKNFSCVECGKTFEKNCLLEVHMRCHSSELPYPCGFCDRRFRYKHNAKNHELIHSKERPYVCQLCGKAFHQLQVLRAHKIVHSSKRSFKCDLCGVSFKKKTNLKTHFYSIIHQQNEEKHNKQQDTVKENILICEQCGRHFISKSVFEAHIRRHLGERTFKCEICPESFFLNVELKRHIQKHTGELPYSCNHCDRRFLDKSNLKQHERIHTNERPFVCQVCGKAFTLSTVLKSHMVIHTGERTFECKVCNMAFKLRKHLVAHNRSKTHKQNEEKQEISSN